MFAFCAIVFFAQSCGNNTPERFSKGPKGVKGPATTNTPTTGDQVTPTQTTGTGSTGTVATTTTGGTGTTGSGPTTRSTGPGSSGEIINSSSSSSSSGTGGRCVDADNENGDEPQAANGKSYAKAYPVNEPVDDNEPCCLDAAGTTWSCVNASGTVVSTYPHSEFPF